MGSADLCLNNPQPDTSWSCKSTDMGLVCHVECLFSSQLAPVPIYTAWQTEARVWTTCPGLNVKRHGRESNLQPHSTLPRHTFILTQAILFILQLNVTLLTHNAFNDTTINAVKSTVMHSHGRSWYTGTVETLVHCTSALATPDPSSNTPASDDFYTNTAARSMPHDTIHMTRCYKEPDTGTGCSI